jgi:hypothetical protein
MRTHFVMRCLVSDPLKGCGQSLGDATDEIVLIALGEQLVMLAHQFEGAQLQRLVAFGIVPSYCGNALKRFLRSHYSALGGLFCELGNARGELYIFLQSRYGSNR